ncbi:MAG TPA: T9SS type A sorting domain-containing protein [Bacteroidetes bacterium]|nr:T9SS type A sorting domain-containing protein [Bacteroidota bacterium]
MKKIWILLILLLGVIQLTGATDFSIYEAGYPQIRDNNVNITGVKDDIYLRGAFVEHNLTMSVSYNFNSWFFKNYNELEFQWRFQLPEEAIVGDLQFWYGDSLIQARILDKWTAELLFSEVSSPFREPAILTRGMSDGNGNVQYEMRIFPIVRGEKQKFHLQYLVPARPTSGKLRTWLPIPQVTANPRGADSLHIDVHYKRFMEAPQIIGRYGATFAHLPADSLYRTAFRIYTNQFVELVIDSPVSAQFDMVAYADSSDSYYQLMVLPPDLPIVRTVRNLLILLDYSVTNTSGLTGELLFSSLKESMLRSLSYRDSVNLIVAYADIIAASERWLAATPANMDSIFVRCTGRDFLHFNSSQELFAAGTSFLQQQATAGEVVWITNRIDLPTTKAGGQEYAAEIISHFPVDTKFHILDLDNITRLRYTGDYGYMVETFSFLSALTRATGGNLFFLRFHSLKNIFDALFFEKVSHYEEVEIQVRFQNGYAYSKQLFSLFHGYYPLDFPVIQTGKYEGDFPAEVTVIGRTADTLAMKTFTIQNLDVIQGSEKIATTWYGHHLQELTLKSQSTWMVNEIIDLSVRSRVLTPYTAFLIPNPDAEDYYRKLQEAQNPEDRYSDNPTGLTGNGQIPDDLFLMQAYPNPFNPVTHLKIQVPHNLRRQEGEVRIFNLMGQVVKTIRVVVPPNGLIELEWDGRNQDGVTLPSGTYFVLFRVKDQVKRLKLLLLR